MTDYRLNLQANIIDRAAGIVVKARLGEIDGDFRSIIHRIETMKNEGDFVTFKTQGSFIHNKTNGHYKKLGTARIQSSTPLLDMDEVVIYMASDGMLWARKSSEFTDGRFKEFNEESKKT